MLKLKMQFLLLKENLNWIIIAAFFFCAGIGAAAFLYGNENLFLGELTASQYKMLQEMAEFIFTGHPLRGIFYLFIHNLLVSLQMMLLGAIIGVPPLLGLFANGALLGSVAAALAREGMPVFSLMLLGILPHGIFELPALIFSAAFGLKTGFHLIFPLTGKKRGESLLTIWREYWSVFPLVLKLLILAAILEVLVTPHLIQQLIS